MILCNDVPGLILFGGKTYTTSISRSTDFGETWDSVQEEFPVEIIAFDQNPNNLSHIMACGFSSSAGGSLFYDSFDHGLTWTESPLFLSDIEVNDIMYSETVPGRLICAAESGIYVTDDCETFTEVFSLETKKLEFDSDRPGELYAACAENGVYWSTDSGTTWEPLPGFYRSDISLETVEVVGTDWLYAGTKGFGVFRLELEPLGISSAPQTVFSAVSVISSPSFNSVTLVVNPSSSNSDLTVFDVSGRVVYSSTIPASTETQSIVLNNLRAGVYFAGLGEQSSFCRFVLLRE